MKMRFSEEASAVFSSAREIAEEFREEDPSTEHLLLAIVRNSESAGARILQQLGIDPKRVCAALENDLPKGDSKPSKDARFSAAARHSIDLAYIESKELGHDLVGTSHLLLGIVQGSSTFAQEVLCTKFYFDVATAREAVRNSETK